jgi:hypothetical protein
VIARDAKRRERVRQILDSGGAKVSADYFHAAMVFQHGEKVSDYQLSHNLALKAADFDPTNKLARWLAAASKDRVLYQVDPSVTDEERAKWNVPPLEQANERAEAMNVAKK